jgi:mannose-6-phosphate isomerase-like protein (cupin superfamily)
MPPPVVAPPLAGGLLDAAGGQFVIAEWRDAGGVSEKPRLISPIHIHHRDDEAWYVLEGVLRVRRGEEEVEAHAGSGVFVPRGTVHTYWNPGPEPLRYLLVMTGNIYRLIEEIHSMQDRSALALAAVFQKYESEFLGWS